LKSALRKRRRNSSGCRIFVCGKILVSEVVHMLRASLVFVGILAANVNLFGQVNDVKDVFVCKKIELSITQAIKGTEIQRRVAYEDECRLRVVTGKDWFSISVAKFESEKESKAEFIFDFDLYLPDDTDSTGVKNLRLHNFWGDAKGHFDISESDQLVMLRYKNVVITLIGSNYSQLLKVESLLRGIG